MKATTPISLVRTCETQRPFSLKIYLLLVFALSWPFQIAYGLWGTTPAASYILSSLSMVMVTVATFIAGRYIFRDGFQNAGWRWGKPKHYVGTFALALFIFAVPTLLEPLLGLRILPASVPIIAILGNFLLRFSLTLIPGFGEEFGWRGYMLPHLAKRFKPRTALLLHGFIWWAWHLPALIGMGARQEELSIAFMLLITLIPSIMNAIIFAYVWTASQSLAVSSVYHSAYDEVRDAIEKSVGFGPLVSLWEMGMTTLLGLILLWRGNWKRLRPSSLD